MGIYIEGEGGHRIQADYERQSRLLDLDQLAKRPLIKRFKENVALLIGPLL